MLKHKILLTIIALTASIEISASNDKLSPNQALNMFLKKLNELYDNRGPGLGKYQIDGRIQQIKKAITDNTSEKSELKKILPKEIFDKLQAMD